MRTSGLRWRWRRRRRCLRSRTAPRVIVRRHNGRRVRFPCQLIPRSVCAGFSGGGDGGFSVLAAFGLCGLVGLGFVLSTSRCSSCHFCCCCCCCHENTGAISMRVREYSLSFCLWRPHQRLAERHRIKNGGGNETGSVGLRGKDTKAARRD